MSTTPKAKKATKRTSSLEKGGPGKKKKTITVRLPYYRPVGSGRHCFIIRIFNMYASRRH